MTAVLQIVGLRLVVAFALLAALVVCNLVAPNVLILLVSGALVVLPIIQWSAVGYFAARSLEDPSIISLRARVQDAFALAMASTVGAILGMLVVARQLNAIAPVDRGVFLVGLSFALLMVAAPAVNWLVTWTPWRRA